MSAAAGPGATGGSRAPARVDSRVECAKDDLFEVCGALALAEAVLRRCGRPLEAARMAEVFSLVEAGLAGTGSAPQG